MVLWVWTGREELFCAPRVFPSSSCFLRDNLVALGILGKGQFHPCRTNPLQPGFPGSQPLEFLPRAPSGPLWDQPRGIFHGVLTWDQPRGDFSWCPHPGLRISVTSGPSWCPQHRAVPAPRTLQAGSWRWWRHGRAELPEWHRQLVPGTRGGQRDNPGADGTARPLAPGPCDAFEGAR